MTDSLEGVKVTVTDARNAGFCAAGMVKYLKDRGLSYRTLRDEGFDAKHLSSYGDANFDKAVEVAVARTVAEREAGQ
ncbi:hypothetical protein [Bacteriophage Phobos]|uniref:Uncharacterized protein n=1 Tax=Bacteriophage Phobos TaxID=2662138 RepID=A0A5Q2U8B3_9CAUD|nr:tail assembly chaperone [Bacteriophage Phobos]QGH45006.1 hypothetical protein [Bacteriophage Phobos]WPK42402.1 hypothetical protein [Pseudomonas phage Ppu-503]